MRQEQQLLADPAGTYQQICVIFHQAGRHHIVVLAVMVVGFAQVAGRR
jgi:hypothetical protein